MDPVLQTVPSRGPGEVPPPHKALKPLWAAIGVLGVAVVALGGTLVYERVADTTPSSTPVAGLTVPVGQAPADTTAPAPAATAKADLNETPVPPAPLASAPPVVQAPPARVVSAPSSVPVYTPQGVIPPAAAAAPQGVYSTSPVASAGSAVCLDCGRVESVSAVRRSAPPSGVGAVAGGVLGAVLGNQIGHGGGRTVTTLLGAGGGAYVGNRIEANRSAHTVYMVHVRMDNGTRRTFERADPVPVGSAVTVQGHNFRLGSGETYSTSTAAAQSAAATQPGTYSTVRN